MASLAYGVTSPEVVFSSLASLSGDANVDGEDEYDEGGRGGSEGGKRMRGAVSASSVKFALPEDEEEEEEDESPSKRQPTGKFRWLWGQAWRLDERFISPCFLGRIGFLPGMWKPT